MRPFKNGGNGIHYSLRFTPFPVESCFQELSVGDKFFAGMNSSFFHKGGRRKYRV